MIYNTEYSEHIRLGVVLLITKALSGNQFQGFAVPPRRRNDSLGFDRYLLALHFHPRQLGT